MSGKTIEEVLKAHSGELMALPGVVGTARGECASRPCIKVYVIEKNAGLPDAIEGYPVMIEETGTLRTLRGKE